MRRCRLLCGFMLTGPLWFGVGCETWQRRPPADLHSQPTPTGMRSQKPEPNKPASLPPITAADGEVAVRTVAYVNNMPIFESELRESMMFRLREVAELQEPERSQKLNEIRNAELEKLIEREVIMDVAETRLKKLPGKVMDELKREANKEIDRRIKDIREQMQVKSEADLKVFFAQQGLSLANFRRSVERTFISTEYMRNMIFPKLQHIPISEVQDYYANHADEFAVQDRVKWQAIFIDAGKFPDRVSARRATDQVLLQLKSGAEFTKVAQDLRQAGYNLQLGDQGIGEKKGEIRPVELEGLLMQMKAGQVGGPVEMPTGYHIVRVTERTQAGKKPLDADVQNDIRRKLQNLLAEKEYRRMVEDMKSRAVIQKIP